MTSQVRQRQLLRIEGQTECEFEAIPESPAFVVSEKKLSLSASVIRTVSGRASWRP